MNKALRKTHLGKRRRAGILNQTYLEVDVMDPDDSERQFAQGRAVSGCSLNALSMQSRPRVG